VQVNPKAKLLMVLLLSSGMILFPVLALVSAAALLLASLIAFFGLQHRFLPWLKTLAIIFALIMIMQSVTHPTAPMSAQALLEGALFSMRIFSLVAAVFLFVETTPATGLADAFGFLPEGISQVLVLSLSLMPGVTQLSGDIMRAQKARGLNFRSMNVLYTYFPLLVPLFAKMLERSEKMALAMEARGFRGE
jgi:energy-coupling factor transport system permease protein